jgi:hypothetical protein
MKNDFPDILPQTILSPFNAPCRELAFFQDVGGGEVALIRIIIALK